jgi:hypothetical protein
MVKGSEAHPNNRFIVYFYDANGLYLGESEMIESSVGHLQTVTYDVPIALWESVIDEANIDCEVDTKINISIGGYRYDNTWVSDESRALSGPYFSSYEELQILIDHSYELQMGDDIFHKCVCTRCSHTITEEHNMYKRPEENNQHAEKCLDCGYIDESTRESHTYENWAYLNETTHISECACGARGTTTQPHLFTFPDSTGKMTCRGCGYVKYEGRDFGGVILANPRVSVNGSYILPDGNVVLADEDLEAYLNGTLVFYEKDKLPVTQ